MKVQDEELWSVQLEEFGADENSMKFRDFLIFWVETAESLSEEYQQTPRGSLMQAFEVAEQSFGYISMEWLGQMLLVVVQHWCEGESVWESLTVWERRLVEQMAAMKVAELQKLAETGLSEDLNPD